MTVGELMEYLAGMPAETPVVIDVNPGFWYLRVENLDVTSDENAVNDDTDAEVILTWDVADDGWLLARGEPTADPTSTAAWPFRTSL